MTNQDPTYEPNGTQPYTPETDAGYGEVASTNNEDFTNSTLDQTTDAQQKPQVKKSFAGSTWVALIVGAILLVLLLVFIMQNQENVQLQLFAWEMTFPIGAGMLIAAIAGALIMALVGGVRIIQLRRQVTHTNR